MKCWEATELIGDKSLPFQSNDSKSKGVTVPLSNLHCAFAKESRLSFYLAESMHHQKHLHRMNHLNVTAKRTPGFEVLLNSWMHVALKCHSEVSIFGAFRFAAICHVSLQDSLLCLTSLACQHPQSAICTQRTGRHRRMLGWHRAEQHWASTQHALFTARQPPTLARLRARFMEVATSSSSPSIALVLLVASTSSIAWPTGAWEEATAEPAKVTMHNNRISQFSPSMAGRETQKLFRMSSAKLNGPVWAWAEGTEARQIVRSFEIERKRGERKLWEWSCGKPTMTVTLSSNWLIDCVNWVPWD